MLAAVNQIASEAQLALPKRAEYQLWVNVRPGDGETVSNNPPVFSWFCNTNFLQGGELQPGQFDFWSEQTNTFTFQVTAASDTSFASPVVNVTTPVNFYNFLGTLDTNTTRNFRWRVIYKTNNFAFFTNTYTFTIANGATNWDRSMLADSAYHATNSVHPIYCFRAGEERDIYKYWETNHAHDWFTLTNYSATATNQSWWTNPVAWTPNSTPDPIFSTQIDWGPRVNQIAAVLAQWTFSKTNQWTNAFMTASLISNLQNMVTWYVSPSNNMQAADVAFSLGVQHLFELLTATYDWTYNYCGTNTATLPGQLRTNALHALQRTWQFMHWNSFYVAWPLTPGNSVTDYSSPLGDTNSWWGTDGGYHGWIYNGPVTGYHFTNKYIVAPYSFAKNANAHLAVSTHNVMQGIVATQQEPWPANATWDWMVNFMFSRSSSFSPFAAHHSGPYGYVANMIPFQLKTMAVFDVAYPQAQIWRTDFAQGFPEWYSRLTPPFMRKLHGPYGDGGPYTENGHSGNWGNPRIGKIMAAVCRSGVAMQHYNINAPLYDDSGESKVEITYVPLMFHYRNSMPAPETNSTSRAFVDDGFVIASSLSPSLPTAYSNAVGFSLQARPRGVAVMHDIPSDLSVDMWAYGAQITDGGGRGLTEYDNAPESSPTLFVNGQGPRSWFGFAGGQYLSPTVPAYARISAYTNSGTNFVYTVADGTALFTNSYAPTSLRTNVTKVKRHILFVRSKYWVIYDEFATVNPSRFAFRWHIPWCTRYEEAASLPGEHRVALSALDNGNLHVSNSLALNSTGFTYTAGNLATFNYQNPPRVPVHVFFGTTNQGVFVATGTNTLSSFTATNALVTGLTNSTLNPFLNGGTTFLQYMPDRAAGVWVTNRGLSTSYGFVADVIPQEPGKGAPVVRRFSDTQQQIVYDGITNNISLSTNYSTGTIDGHYVAFDTEHDFIIDANAAANPEGGDPVAPPVVRTLNAVRSTAGRVVQ